MCPSKPRQLPLFTITPNGYEEIHKFCPSRFYYVTDGQKKRMLFSASANTQDWVEHDLRYMLPWLTNSLKEAHRVAAQYKGAYARIYPYNPSAFGKKNEDSGGWPERQPKE